MLHSLRLLRVLAICFRVGNELARTLRNIAIDNGQQTRTDLIRNRVQVVERGKDQDGEIAAGRNCRESVLVLMLPGSVSRNRVLACKTGWELLRIWMGSINQCLLGVSRGIVIKVLMTRHPDSPALEVASVSCTKEMVPRRNAEDLALIILQASSQQASTPQRKWTLRTMNKTFLVQCLQCDVFSPLEVRHWDAEGRAQVVNGHTKYSCPDREMNEQILLLECMIEAESEFTDLVCACTPSCTLFDSCTFPLYVSVSVLSLLSCRTWEGPGWIDHSRQELQTIGVGINAARETGWESLRVWTGSSYEANLTTDRGVVIKVLMTWHPDSPALELASISHTKEVSVYWE
ncbi:hypothetical protein IW261DRAFT_1424757 [Armillaria novae-zelandiae]|uniref:RNase H type-1 domain-containing protein n=1 Tax=Armillaria novae-zelandiae TaxID=153914 RepID=A0AA39U0Z3_9AGAR|nr:hypothetical protein IW261DRAFT_1424757 [Armillaria novae-zelandiae]